MGTTVVAIVSCSLLGLFTLPARSAVDENEAQEVAVSIEAVTETPAAESLRAIIFDEVVYLALANNIDLALAKAEEQIARGRAQSSYGGLLPALEFGGFVRSREGRMQGSFGAIREVDYDTYDRMVAAVYRINIGLQIHESIASGRDVGAAVLKTLDRKQRLLLRVTELYQHLLLARIGVQIAEALVADSEQFVQIAEARAETGLGRGSEVARAEAKLASDRQQQVQARQIWEVVSVRLAEVLRLDPRVILEPAERELIPLSVEPPRESWNVTEAALHRPDVEAARKDEGVAAQKSYASWWDLLGPELMASWNLHNIGASRNDLDDRTDNQILLAWSISLDKFGRIKQRSAEKQAARLKITEAEQRALAETEVAQSEVRASRRKIPLAQEGLAAAQTNLRISRARYESGTALALEVLDAQDTLAQARLDLARAIVSLNLAQARLLAAAGVIDREMLAEDTGVPRE